MPKFNYLDRINYGPHKGEYDYNGRHWTDTSATGGDERLGIGSDAWF